jgi:hypothetical protein
MKNIKKYVNQIFLIGVCVCFMVNLHAQNKRPLFKVIAFYTAKSDLAHISFVHEANRFFPQMGAWYNFSYDSTNNWSNLNEDFLSQYQVVIFLDTRPENRTQRDAFKKFMDNGGAFIGFHFAGFALNNSDFPQNWEWYHNTFIGAGQYKSNTWHPTSAILRVEDTTHPVTKDFPRIFKSSPNEWYRWEKDIRLNPDIKILLSIDSTSFPLGNGPKQSEIWHSGYYPVVWTNTKYKMLYVNMGHNDIDYDNKTNKELSFQFGNDIQDKMIVNALIWLGTKK